MERNVGNDCISSLGKISEAGFICGLGMILESSHKDEDQGNHIFIEILKIYFHYYINYIPF